MGNKKKETADSGRVDKKTIGLTVKKSENISEWYTQVVIKSEMADYSPVSGCMVLKPYSYEIWENIQRVLDAEFKATGHKNAYFPLLIPESLLMKEKEHIEGFSPEVAWVTEAGNHKLNERLAIRPTSETIIYDSYSRWVRSWRDLPLLINQWCSVVRWEFKYPRPFLRTREFLWQEGHTVHASKEEAEEEVVKMLHIYKNFVEEYLAVPVFEGRKTESEKFAGAEYTLTIESLMPDGKALQMGTSHHLGQNFSKPFNIQFLDRDEKKRYAWQTSWGVSTRMIGGMILVHGDDKGLVLPPRIAPVQAVIIPILFKGAEGDILKYSNELYDALKEKGVRVLLDDSDYTAGWKFHEWELKGVPLRVEAGPRDIKEGKAVIVRRDTGERISVGKKALAGRVVSLLGEIQSAMLERARKRVNEHMIKVDNLNDFKDAIKRGMMVKAYCSLSSDCEEKIKEETGATPRLIPLSEYGKKRDEPCVICGKKPTTLVYFARAY